MKYAVILAVSAAGLLVSFDPPACLAADDAPERLEVIPQTIKLPSRRSGTQIIVIGHYQDGRIRDLTHDAKIVAPSFVTLNRAFVTPRSDGKGHVTISVGTLRQTIPIVATGFQKSDPVSFRRELLAVLTKQGCNSGACHGKPNGRGSLELSLNAFDPKLDERNLIRGGLVRFTHPIQPDESLMLKKPMLRVPHGGGKKLRPDDAAFAIIRQWIFEGCNPDAQESATVLNLMVSPRGNRVLSLPEARQQLRVVAHLSDGSFRDVTRIVKYSVSNSKVASVDAAGLVTGIERGQTAIVVRYLSDIAAVNMTFVSDVPGFVWNKPRETNYVDQFAHQKLRQLQYLPSGVCDDSTFIRRLSLDVRGLLPAPNEVTAFLEDKQADKRSRLIDRYLDSVEHARFWSLRLADLLRINLKTLSPDRADAYSSWVFQSVRDNQPYDQFVRELLTSRGKTSAVQAANFFRTSADTKTTTETVAQLFMGSRVMCAQCHNHPYESWTQDNYYQIGAAFHQVDRKGLNKKNNANVEVTLTFKRGLANPRTGVVQQPWPTNVVRKADEDFRVEFANWLTAAENPYFARVAVNRIWAHLMGRGIVMPVDDYRSSNPPTNSELLDALAADFTKSSFDRKHMLRVMLNSQTYQRSSETNDFNVTDEQLFSHAKVRMLSAEQMQDAVHRLCLGTQEYDKLQQDRVVAEKAVSNAIKQAGAGSNFKALKAARDKLKSIEDKLKQHYMSQAAWPKQTPFLKAFGQPERMTACACERREEASLEQALQLINNNVVRSAVASAGRRLTQLSNPQIVDLIYLAAFSRHAKPSERTSVENFLAAADDRVSAIEDVVWAIINTNEFLFQH